MYHTGRRKFVARVASWLAGAAAWTLYRRARYAVSVEHELRDCHTQLLLLLRMWLLAVEILKATGLSSRKSYVSLIRLPQDMDYEGGCNTSSGRGVCLWVTWMNGCR